MRLIDADAVKQTMIETMEALLKNPKMDNQEAHLLAAFHTVGKMIDDAPTVSPDMAQVLAYECGKAERKRGEWIDLGKDRAIRWQCSECGRKDTHIYNYCQDCGADMRGQANDAICSK